MKKAHTLATGALLALTGAAGYAAGPDAIGPGAYDRLSTDVASNTIVVWWGQDATQAMRTAAITAIDGSVFATDDEGAQILSVGIGLSQARVLLEQFPSTIISTVESTDAFIGNQFGLDSHMLEVLTIPSDASRAVLVPVILDGGVYTLELTPRSVRSDDFQLLVEQEDGSLVEIEAPASNTFRGRIVEMPGSMVAASVDDDGLTATIVLDNDLDAGWFIQPLNDVVDGAPSNVHVVYDSQATQASEGVCGGALLPDNPVVGIGAQQGNTQRGLITAEIAYDADFQFYQQNGSSTTNTTNDINNIQNAVNVIYERDTGVTFIITQIIIRTSSGSNPYTTNDPGGLLDQFRSYWLSNHGNIQRDLAHLMTGRNLSGSVIGVAWLSSVCTSFGYGLSQSRFTGNFNSRVALTAHEIGHNFSAGHCSGGGCFIMCAGLGGCGGIGLPNFGTSSSNTISNYAAGRPCLDSGPPPNQPPTVQVVLPFNGTTVDEGTTLTYSAIADDPEQGDIGDDLIWSSNLDGVFGTGNTFPYAGLSAGTHTITASVTDNGGLSDSDAVTVIVNSVGGGSPPDRPARPTVQDLGGGTARVNWTDLPNETSWDVRRQEKVGGVWMNTTIIANNLPQDTVTYDDSPGFGTWRYAVRASNSAGNSSWSQWRGVNLIDSNNQPPDRPARPTVQDLGSGTARVNWTDLPNETSWDVRRQEKVGGVWTNTTVIANNLPQDTVTYDDSPGFGTWRYSVRARNSAGNSSWSQWRGINLQDPSPPSAPTNMSATNIGGGQVMLSWIDTSSNEWRFQLQRQQRIGGAWVNQGVIAQPGANVESYTDAPGSGQFRYRVRARNGAGSSAWTSWAGLTLP